MSPVAQQIVDAGARSGALSTPPRLRTSGVVPALKPKRGLPPPAITAASLSVPPLASKTPLGGQPPPLARASKEPALARGQSVPVIDPEEEREWQRALAHASAQIAAEQRAAEQQAAERRAAEQDERDWQQAIAQARARVAEEEREWSSRIARVRSEPSFFLDAPPSRPPAKLPGALHFWP